MKKPKDSDISERYYAHDWTDDTLESYDKDPRRPPYKPERVKTNPPRDLDSIYKGYNLRHR